MDSDPFQKPVFAPGDDVSPRKPNGGDDGHHRTNDQVVGRRQPPPPPPPPEADETPQHEPIETEEESEHDSQLSVEEERTGGAKPKKVMSPKKRNLMLRGGSNMNKMAQFRVGKVIAIVYTLLCAISFVLMVIASSPVPWFEGASGRRWTLWKGYDGLYPNGLPRPERSVTKIDTCSEEQQYWQLIEGMSIMSTVFCLLGAVSGVVLLLGFGHIGLSMVLALYGFTTTLTAWALTLALYYARRCGKGVISQGLATPSIGFALAIVSWGLMAVALTLIIIFFLGAFRPNNTYPSRHFMRTFYMFITGICTLLVTIGAAVTLWQKQFPNKMIKVRLWHTLIFDNLVHFPQVFSVGNYHCSAYTLHMRIGAAMTLLSAFFLYVTLLLATIAVYRPTMYIPSGVMGGVSCVFLLVSIGVLIAARFRTFCRTEVSPDSNLWVRAAYNGAPTGVANATISFAGYRIAEGLGMIIAAWVVMLLSTLANLLVGRKNGRDFDDENDPFNALTESSYHYSVADPLEMQAGNTDPFDPKDRNDPFREEKPIPEGGWGENEPFYSEIAPGREMLPDYSAVNSMASRYRDEEGDPATENESPAGNSDHIVVPTPQDGAKWQM